MSVGCGGPVQVSCHAQLVVAGMTGIQEQGIGQVEGLKSAAGGIQALRMHMHLYVFSANRFPVSSAREGNRIWLVLSLVSAPVYGHVYVYGESVCTYGEHPLSLPAGWTWGCGAVAALLLFNYWIW